MARERPNIMRETSDGFRIAEKDLELRGPGEVLGTRQTGLLQFRVADLARDQDLLQRIPEVATGLLENNPEQARKLVQRWIGEATRFANAYTASPLCAPGRASFMVCGPISAARCCR